MMETVDGDYQAMKANDGAYIRKHFFGKYPRPPMVVEHMSDDEIFELPAAATIPKGLRRLPRRPECHNKGPADLLLVKTVKGLAWARPARQNTVHQTKEAQDDDIPHPPLQHPHPDSDSCPRSRTTSRPTTRRRCATCTSVARPSRGYLPHRRTKADEHFKTPELSTFQAVLTPRRRPRDLDHPGLCALPDPVAARQGKSAPRGAHPR